jgi:hypothetical protein
MLQRPDNAQLIRRGLAGLDLSARSRAGWADPTDRENRVAAAKASWKDPEIRARRRAAITAAMRDPDTRRKLSNSRRKPIVLNGLLGLIMLPKRRAIDDAAALQFAAFAAYESALAAAAGALKLDLDKARKGNAATSAGQARAIATYLAVTFFDIPRRALAAARNADLRGLRRVCTDVESRRDDPAFEALLCSIEERLRR